MSKKIIDISDYTMVVQIGSDPGSQALKKTLNNVENKNLIVTHPISWSSEILKHGIIVSDCLYSGDILVLYFKDKILDKFKKGDRVMIFYKLKNYERFK